MLIELLNKKKKKNSFYCRFYKYDKNERFAPHFDGCFPRSRSEMSMLTFIIYLSDDFEGGNTTFFSNQKTIQVKPKKGSALLFWHGSSPYSPMHEGSTLVGGGLKYVFRSDIMFKKQN